MNGYGIQRQDERDKRFVTLPPDLQGDEWEEITPETVGVRSAPQAVSSSLPPDLQGDEWEEISPDQYEAYKQAPPEPPTFVGRVKKSWETGQTQTELGLLRYQQIMGDTSAETEQRAMELKALIPKIKTPRSLPEQAVSAAAEMLPIQVSGMKKGAERGLALGMGAGAIAAVAGQAGPQIATPEELITVPAAFTGMFGVGMLSGTLENIGQIEAGLAYDELLDLKDKKGQGLDPALAKGAAAGVGVVNGLLELGQIKLLIKTIPGGDKLLSGAIRAATKKAITSKALHNLAFKKAAQYGKFIGEETLQEIAQESTNIVAGALTTELNNRLKGTDIPRATQKEVIARLVDTAKQSALAFSVMGLPGHAASTVYEATGKQQQEQQPTPTDTPSDLIDDSPEKIAAERQDLKKILTSIEKGLQSGTMTPEQVDTYKAVVAEDYAAYPKALEYIDQLLSQVEQQQEPLASERDLVPVGITGEHALKSAEESAGIFEQQLNQEEELRQSTGGGMLLSEQLAAEQEAKGPEIPMPAEFEEEIEPLEAAPYELGEDWEDMTGEEAEKPQGEPITEEDLAKGIEEAAQEAETEPTEKQKESGVYKKGHIKLQGLDISIENPRGSQRRGVDKKTGKMWRSKLGSHYGYIKGGIRKDKDSV